MFIELAQMIAQASLSGVHLMVRPLAEGKLSVMVATESDTLRAENPALKAALAQPLNIRGDATQLDEDFQTVLNNFIASYTDAAISSNQAAVSDAHAAATAAAPAPATAATVADSDSDQADDAVVSDNTIITDETELF